MGQCGLSKGLLLAANPNVVGNVAKSLVAVIEVENGTEFVLKVVTTARLKTDAVKVEPGTPEEARPGVDVAVEESSSVVSEGEVDLVLDVEVDNTKDTTRGQKGGNRVDNRVVVGLQTKLVKCFSLQGSARLTIMDKE